MVLFMGLLPGSVALALLALWQMDGPALFLALAGALSYLLGVFVVTVIGNVPMNKGLTPCLGEPANW